LAKEEKEREMGDRIITVKLADQTGSLSLLRRNLDKFSKTLRDLESEGYRLKACQPFSIVMRDDPERPKEETPPEYWDPR
jgi:hypothetical protein